MFAVKKLLLLLLKYQWVTCCRFFGNIMFIGWWTYDIAAGTLLYFCSTQLITVYQIKIYSIHVYSCETHPLLGCVYHVYCFHRYDWTIELKNKLSYCWGTCTTCCVWRASNIKRTQSHRNCCYLIACIWYHFLSVICRFLYCSFGDSTTIAVWVTACDFYTSFSFNNTVGK